MTIDDTSSGGREDALRRTREDPLGGDDRSWFEKLVAIVDALRSPGGCPWDLEQTHESLRPFVLEEAYEVAEAIDGGNPDELCEELGDLLLQVVLQARLGQEGGRFTIGEVSRGIAEKLVRRHPHVFGDAEADSPEAVISRWERIKREEKGGEEERSVLAGIPAALPALLKAYRLGQKAGRVGFDWDDAAGALDKAEEELRELRLEVEGGRERAAREELGDLLFALGQLARKLGADPEETLQAANEKFARRFRALEARLRESGRSWEESDLESLEAIWQSLKDA